VCSRLEYNTVYSVENLLATCFTLISCLAYSSTLKMEATYFSETSVGRQRTARLYVPEGIWLADISLYLRFCDETCAPSRQ
jgi:hypothetical protein